MDSQIDAADEPQETLPELLPPSRALVPAPVGAPPASVSAWFDRAVDASEPVVDGTLAGEREAAETYRRMAKADNTRRAYRAAVRAWCSWCVLHGLCPLPACSQDVAAFLAGERGRKLSPETLKLQRAAIRYLHRAAGCPVPTDDVCVSETMAGITRDAARKGVVPRKKVAATATIMRRLLAPIPGDLRGLRDRAVLLVGFAGALRRSELAAIRFDHLEKTDRGIRLTLPQTKGEQTDAVTVPPALWRYGALSGACARRLAACGGPRGWAGVPEDLAAAAAEVGSRGRAPAPGRHGRDHAADRGADRPGPRDGGRLRAA